MNISNETLDILRNFSSINSGITVKAGNELVTVSAMVLYLCLIDQTLISTPRK